MPTNTEVFFAQLMTLREKQILARASGIQIENWGGHAKMQSNVWHLFSQIKALVSLKNAWLPQIFFLGTKSIC